MAEPQPLDILAERAEKTLEEATRSLGAAHQQRDQANQQLEQLISYLADYQAQWNRTMATGMTAAGWQNYQRFIETLEAAIDGQRALAQQLEGQLEQSRQHWQHCRQRRQAFDALAARRQQVLDHKVRRQEQRQSDDIAARIALRRSA